MEETNTETKSDEKANDNKDVKAETKVYKAAVVEAVADQLKAEVEKREKEIVRYKEKLAKEAQAKLEAAPEDIKERYKGKEIDISTLENLENDIAKHNEMIERAKTEAKAQVEAYKKEVFEKYGVKLPDTQGEKPAQKNVKKEEVKDEGRKVTRIIDIAEKDKLSFDDLKAITSNYDAMKTYIAERKKIVTNN
jgi:hypothetical protein